MSFPYHMFPVRFAADKYEHSDWSASYRLPTQFPGLHNQHNITEQSQFFFKFILLSYIFLPLTVIGKRVFQFLPVRFSQLFKLPPFFAAHTLTKDNIRNTAAHFPEAFLINVRILNHHHIGCINSHSLLLNHILEIGRIQQLAQICNCPLSVGEYSDTSRIRLKPDKIGIY